MTTPPGIGQLVVVGASAGGIEALSTLIASLPAGFPAPVLIAQHLDPTRPSHLEEILRRASLLPVRTVSDREHLAPGTVYVIASNRNVAVTHHDISVIEDGGARPMPSVNLLFGSAAEAFGENLYAIILTGSGSDGADGARRVKEAGGTVIIQNPATASFPSMPLSLAPSSVDIVAELDAMGALLVDLLSGAYQPPPEAEDQRMRQLLEQVRSRSGIDFGAYRQPTIHRRLRRRMADTQQHSVEDYLRYLQRHPEEYQRLANSFLVQVTEFFRDPEIFEALRTRVLPQLIEEARSQDRQLRIWSAGCATGEEAYSVAMLVADLLGDDGDSVDVRLFATDIDPESIAFARRRIYSPATLGGVPPGLAARYLTPVDDGLEVTKQVRRMVVFGLHDLGQSSPFPHIDLVLCRNVLIYFTPELQRGVLQLFAYSLREGGCLMLGKSETTNPLPEYFTPLDAQFKLYRRLGLKSHLTPKLFAGAALGAGPAKAAGPDPSWERMLPGHGRQGAARPTGLVQPERSGRGDLLLSDLPVGVVVVNRNYDIQAINNQARTLLGIHTTAIGQDLVHMARHLPSDLLRNALDRAFQGEQSAVQVASTVVSSAGAEPRALDLSFFPRPDADDERRVNLATMIVAEAPTLHSEPPADPGGMRAVHQRLEEVQSWLGEAAREPGFAASPAWAGLQEAFDQARTQIEALQGPLEELSASKRALAAANQELAATASLLRSQNEDLVFGNENAQAAVEEIETLSEEQQATNEELETLNEELQATVEELHATNEDLEARGREQQATSAALEIQRARLATVLAGMSEGVALVDAAGNVLVRNAALEQMFGSPPDFAALDEAGAPLPPEASPQQRARQSEAFTMRFTRRGADGGRRWYNVAAQPVSLSGENGVVLVVRDVSDDNLFKSQTAFLATATHELATPLTVLGSVLELVARQSRTAGLDERLLQYVEQGKAQLQFVRDILGELTDEVRLREGKLHQDITTVDLVALVQQSVEVLRVMLHGLEVRVTAPAGPIYVAADAARLNQVITNLLTNAARYGTSDAGVDVVVRAAGTMAEVEVQDYGQGIEEANLALIFTRFYQAPDAGDAQRHGMGLGLYIARQIAEAHGGKLTVRSAVGSGSTFTLQVPLTAPPAP